MTVPVVVKDPLWEPSQKPPARIYISGVQYKIVAPSVALPPLPGAAKVILNWAAPALGRVAKNIMYAFLPSGADPSVTANLQSIANGVEGAIRSSNVLQQVNIAWQLTNVTAKDYSGTSENFATSTHAADNGLDTGTCTPPQCAVCVSWTIGASYRGGKPRTYVPGVSISALIPAGSSTLDGTWAGLVATHWMSFVTACNAVTVGSGPMNIGTISFRTGHAVRPTPIFRPFLSVRVHERLDSQRRRSGKESAFGVVP